MSELQAKQKAHAMNKIVRCMKGQQDAASMGEALQHWSKHAASGLDEAYAKLYKKFQRAMLCARKYEWDTAKCVLKGREIEAAVASQAGTPEEKADFALEIVVDTIRQEKSLQLRRVRAINKIVQVIMNEGDNACKVDAIQHWESQASAELDVVYKKLMVRFQRAMCFMRKQNW